MNPSSFRRVMVRLTVSMVRPRLSAISWREIGNRKEGLAWSAPSSVGQLEEQGCDLLLRILATQEQHVLVGAPELVRRKSDQALGQRGLLAHRRCQGGAARLDQRGVRDRLDAVGVMCAEQPEAIPRGQEVDELTAAVDGRLVQAHGAGQHAKAVSAGVSFEPDRLAGDRLHCDADRGESSSPGKAR